jgi:membrane protein
MTRKLSDAWLLVKDSVTSLIDDKGPRLAAALAFYTLLSLSPLVVIAVAIAGLAFGEEAARGQIAAELSGVVGAHGASVIETLVQNAERPEAGVASSIIGLVVLLFGASGVFGELQDALNTIWRVEPKPGLGLRGLIRERLFSFAMVMGVAFLLLVSLVVSAVLAAAGKYLSGHLPGGDLVWNLLNGAISLVVIAGLFAATFKTVPSAHIAWRDVWIGAAVTALLFTLGKFAIGLYLGRSSVSSTYGAAGSLVALIVWVYYSAIILFFGAAFTRVYAERFGSHIEPSENAVAADDADAKKQRDAGKPAPARNAPARIERRGRHPGAGGHATS